MPLIIIIFIENLHQHLFHLYLVFEESFCNKNFIFLWIIFLECFSVTNCSSFCIKLNKIIRSLILESIKIIPLENSSSLNFPKNIFFSYKIKFNYFSLSREWTINLSSLVRYLKHWKKQFSVFPSTFLTLANVPQQVNDYDTSIKWSNWEKSHLTIFTSFSLWEALHLYLVIPPFKLYSFH